MFIMLRLTYPYRQWPSTEEILKRQPKMPGYIKSEGIYYRGDIVNGIEIYAIFKISVEAQATKGYQPIFQMLELFRDIEGFKWQIDVIDKVPQPTDDFLS